MALKPLLVVDGYNIIGAWEQAAREAWTFEECRERLFARLVEYVAYHDMEAVLVFDGTHSDRLVRTSESQGAVEVVYTRHG